MTKERRISLKGHSERKVTEMGEEPQHMLAQKLRPGNVLGTKE
jgi:hypothetical protein